MELHETREIINLLNGIYQVASCNDDVINAWHEILKDESYKITRLAVIEMARQDERDKCELPAPGMIYRGIQKAKEIYEGIRQLAIDGVEYKNLVDTAQNLVSKEMYNKMLIMDNSEVKKLNIDDIAFI